jgi:prepilin-type N-terminal cleavage/methylation domain-containing protein
MNANWIRRVNSTPFRRGSARCEPTKRNRKKTHSDDGFTLVELLITLTIIPLVVGALSLGIIALFSLNTQTTNRVTDTADAQVVASTYQKDVQSAGYITTDSDSSPQCGPGTGTQLLALESVPNQKTGDFQTVVSYVAVPTSAAATSYSLVRLYCTNGSTAPASQTTLAFDLPAPSIPPGANANYKPLTPPTITCSSAASADVCSESGRQWTLGYVPAQDIGTVSFDVTEPSSSYNYVLAASPAASATFNSGGVASTPAAPCEQTQVNSGQYGGQLCLIDFSGLSQNDIAVAESPGQCYNMSVAVGVSDILHFCLGITSNNAAEGVVPTQLPADANAGLGSPGVYAGVGGEPALYMNPIIGPTTTLTMSLSGFSLIDAATGKTVSGWTSNGSEYITWTSNVPITVVDDAAPGATNSMNQPDPIDGDACQVTGSGTTMVTCANGPGSENVPLTGAAMVSMLGDSLSSVVVNMNNHQAIAFGVFT